MKESAFAALDGSFFWAYEHSASSLSLNEVFPAVASNATAFFETVRVCNQAPLLLNLHAARLYQMANSIGVTPMCSSFELANHIFQECRSRNVVNACLRLAMLPVSGDDDGDTGDVQAIPIMFGAPWKYQFRKAKWLDGIRLLSDFPGMIRQPASGDAPLPYGAKTAIDHSNRMRARGFGFDDALDVTEYGEVVSACGASIVAVLDGVLVSCLCDRWIPSVQLQLLRTFADNLGVPWEERPVAVKELNYASEVLISNVAAEVVPVVQVNDVPYVTGEITQMLQHEYKNWLLSEARLGVARLIE